MCDELEDLRDQIKALQGMNVQQLVRFPPAPGAGALCCACDECSV